MDEKMTLHTTRSEKWKAYSGMAAAFLAMNHEAEAQVVYTDIDPDLVLNGTSYAIDFDGDGTPDIDFQHMLSNFTTSSGSTINVRAALANGDIIGQASSSYVYGSVLAAGASIAPGDPNWNVASYGILGFRIAYGTSASTSGNWPGQTAYLGCRFVSGLGTTHYAWVKLNVDPQVATMTLMGYAFESTPNTAIIAGDEGTTTAIKEVLSSGLLQVFPNPVKDMTTVRIGDELSGQVSVQVLDAIGQVVHQAELNTLQGTRTIDLDLSGLSAGNYFVAVTNADRVIHRQVTKVD